MHHHVTKKRNGSIDNLLYFFAITTPLFELPQAYTIFKNQSAQDISLIPWCYFLLSDIVWLIYGIKNKIKPLIFAHILYLAIEGLIAVGIVIYN